jgi:hypothetical protein
MHIAAKRALEEIDIRSKGVGGNVTGDKNVIMWRISHVSTRLDYESLQTSFSAGILISYSHQNSLFLIKLHGYADLRFIGRWL